MRILIVNTSEKAGGAALAAGRLTEALNRNGAQADMLVRDKQTENARVESLPRPWQQQWNFLWERWCVFCNLRFSRRHLWDIDIANTGTDITRLPIFRQADIVHLHWINQGMLSLKGIAHILDSGKPVVWTMHDAWPSTALCHLTLGCRRFTSHCDHCPLLPGGGGENDLAARTWKRKEDMLRRGNITFVACSRWLAEEARQSRLLEGHRVTTIPNPIDTGLFHPTPQAEARRQLGLPADARLILFVSQRVTNKNKGMDYLAEACNRLCRNDGKPMPETALVVMGGHAEEVGHLFNMKVYAQGYVNDARRIALTYSAADVFVLPSLSENLPNTIMEAMACGVPCVAFNTGGIPEEIDHLQNGFVAQYRDADDLARGIGWVLFEADREQLRRNALDKVRRCFSEESVARQFMTLYEEVSRK